MDVEQNASDSREQKTSEPQARGEMMIKTIAQAQNAIQKLSSGSMTHEQVVKVNTISQAIDKAQKMEDWRKLEKHYAKVGDAVSEQQTRRQRLEAEGFLTDLQKRLLVDIRGS